jgi:protocatechuate 3,4-dioxygenase beta subunit
MDVVVKMDRKMLRRSSMLRPTLALCLVLVAADVAAQQPGMPGGTPRPQGPLPGGRVQRPPRDARETPTGTAVIRGRIVAADTGAPIRRAQIRAFSPEARESRGTSTDAQGRFELRDLPQGRWEVVASKAGFVTLRFGQRRPLEGGQQIELSEGETMARANIALPRGGVVTGRILDEFGEPVAGARVQTMRYRAMQGTRQLMPTGPGDSTDDTGAFRLYGLMPGDYYITAVAQMGMFADDSNDTTGYAPTYYPGTGNVAEAQRVSVGVGQEVSNVTFALLATRTVRITGTVIDSKGERVANAFVMLQDTEAAGGMFMQRGGGRVRPDGSFILSNVTPGTYTLTVNTAMGMGSPGGDEPEFATVRVTVGNEDLSGINLVTNKGATVSGSVVPAAGAAGNLSTAGAMVMHQPARFEMMMGMGMRPAKVESDGTFRVTGVQGQRIFRVNGLPPNWMMKAVILNGDDVTDKPVEFKGSEEVTGLQILVTDRVPEVNGRVTTAKGEPTRDYTVLIFPADSSKWGYPSRHIRSGRADQEGMFKIRALPPDEEYLAVAVDYIEEGEGGDPEFLGQMKERATRLSVADGEVKTLDLKLINR